MISFERLGLRFKISAMGMELFGILLHFSFEPAMRFPQWCRLKDACKVASQVASAAISGSFPPPKLTSDLRMAYCHKSGKKTRAGVAF